MQTLRRETTTEYQVQAAGSSPLHRDRGNTENADFLGCPKGLTELKQQLHHNEI